MREFPKGGGGKLQIAEEGAQRFVVGLSWDPPEAPNVKVDIAPAAEKGDKLGQTVDVMMKPFDFFRIFFQAGNKLLKTGAYAEKLGKDTDTKGRDKTAIQYDLDLDCYVFDAALKLQRVVGTEDGALIDPSGKIYHSGDNQGGAGAGDDETIYVETKGLPPNYHHLFFIVKSDSRYHLGEFRNPAVRIADAKTNQNALQLDIAPEAGAGKFYNFVFCHVYRDGEGWRFRNLEEYLNDDVEWEFYLPQLAKP